MVILYISQYIVIYTYSEINKTLFLRFIIYKAQ